LVDIQHSKGHHMNMNVDLAVICQETGGNGDLEFARGRLEFMNDRF
jgi:hypothetical protein